MLIVDMLNVVVLSVVVLSVVMLNVVGPCKVLHCGGPRIKLYYSIV